MKRIKTCCNERCHEEKELFRRVIGDASKRIRDLEDELRLLTRDLRIAEIVRNRAATNPEKVGFISQAEIKMQEPK